MTTITSWVSSWQSVTDVASESRLCINFDPSPFSKPSSPERHPVCPQLNTAIRPSRKFHSHVHLSHLCSASGGAGQESGALPPSCPLILPHPSHFTAVSRSWSWSPAPARSPAGWLRVGVSVQPAWHSAWQPPSRHCSAAPAPTPPTLNSPNLPTARPVRRLTILDTASWELNIQRKRARERLKKTLKLKNFTK